jgi:hypothetical protein
VELSEGLQLIDSQMFRNFTSLQRISIPSTVKIIRYLAFDNCNQLKSVELSEGLQLIDKQAFRNCTSLEGVSIPSTVKHIRM